MLEDVAIGGSRGAGRGSGQEGALVFPGAVTNQLAWCGKVTLLMVGLSSDSLWMCAAAGTVVRGIEYAREMTKTRSQTQRLARAPGRAVSAGHARGEGERVEGGRDTSRSGEVCPWWSARVHGAMWDVLGIWARRKGGQTCGGAGRVSVAWGVVEGRRWGSGASLWGPGYVVRPGDVVGRMECGTESAKAAVRSSQVRQTSGRG